MGRTVTLVVNTGLFVLCCALVARIGNAVIGAALAPPLDTRALSVEREPLARVAWNDRAAIVERNLFDSTTVAPPSAVPPPEEDLEATELPLKLLGTAAADQRELSWAVIEDLQERETLVVRNDDEVRQNAVVLRIERRRIVLDENGSPRELTLGEEETDEEADDRSRRNARRARPARRSRVAARRAAAPERVEVPRREVEKARTNPTSLFSQARIVPKYEEGEIVGLQINDPKPGSVFEQAGIESGEVITEVNGVRIEGAQQSRQVMTELSQSNEWTVYVEGPGGSRSVTISTPEEEEE